MSHETPGPSPTHSSLDQRSQEMREERLERMRRNAIVPPRGLLYRSSFKPLAPESLRKRIAKTLKKRLFGSPPTIAKPRPYIRPESFESFKARLKAREMTLLQEAARREVLQQTSARTELTTVYESPKPTHEPPPTSPVIPDTKTQPETFPRSAPSPVGEPERSVQTTAVWNSYGEYIGYYDGPDFVPETNQLKAAIITARYGVYPASQTAIKDIPELIREKVRRAAAAAAQQSTPPLPKSLQAEPSLSPGQDIHPPDYYRGGAGNYPSLPQGLQTNPGGLSDIHPRGYHTGGGPYLPPGLRTGGGK